MFLSVELSSFVIGIFCSSFQSRFFYTTLSLNIFLQSLSVCYFFPFQFHHHHHDYNCSSECFCEFLPDLICKRNIIFDIRSFMIKLRNFIFFTLVIRLLLEENKLALQYHPHWVSHNNVLVPA